uniref:Uncharacterized protein n=1 Tax=Plectus sambesii TaxID=2011161 RepID=A0A914W8A1_9BILA
MWSTERKNDGGGGGGGSGSSSGRSSGRLGSSKRPSPGKQSAIVSSVCASIAPTLVPSVLTLRGAPAQLPQEWTELRKPPRRRSSFFMRPTGYRATSLSNDDLSSSKLTLDEELIDILHAFGYVCANLLRLSLSAID